VSTSLRADGGDFVDEFSIESHDEPRAETQRSPSALNAAHSRNAIVVVRTIDLHLRIAPRRRRWRRRARSESRKAEYQQAQHAPE
jgi:hypothetical protein